MNLRIDRVHIHLPAHMENLADRLAHGVARTLASTSTHNAGQPGQNHQLEHIRIVVPADHYTGPDQLAAVIARRIDDQIGKRIGDPIASSSNTSISGRQS